jgi:cyclopropane fatty-acyl-phospholipid synthase-like methyltransferase
MQIEQLAEWIARVDGLDLKLARGGTALDLECEDGTAVVALARGFPRARVFAFARTIEQLERAQARARAAGVIDRIRFAQVDWSTMPRWGFDLISTFDFVFKSARPEALLTSVSERAA